MAKRGSRVFRLLGMVLLVNIPAGAQQAQAPTASTAANLQSEPANSDVHHPVPAERNPRYRISRDDVLSLAFSLSPEWNQ